MCVTLHLITAIMRVFYNKGAGLLTALLLLTFTSCRKETTDLAIAGEVQITGTNGPAAGVQVSLYQTVVASGTFNGNAQLVESKVTDGNGAFAFDFPRENALSYELRFNGAGYFDRTVTINPEDVPLGSVYCLTAHLDEGGSVETRIVNAGAGDSDDLCQFRFLNPGLGCSCCTEDLVVLGGANVDSTWTCPDVANKWLRYLVEINAGENFSISVDSVFIAPQEVAVIEISY